MPQTCRECTQSLSAHKNRDNTSQRINKTPHSHPTLVPCSLTQMLNDLLSKTMLETEEMQPKLFSVYSSSSTSSSLGENSNGNSGIIICTDKELNAIHLVRSCLHHHHCIININSTQFRILSSYHNQLQNWRWWNSNNKCEATWLDEEVRLSWRHVWWSFYKWWKIDPITKRKFVRHYPLLGTDEWGCTVSWLWGSGYQKKSNSSKSIPVWCNILSVYSDANKLCNCTSLIVDLSMAIHISYKVSSKPFFKDHRLNWLLAPVSLHEP